MSDSTKTILIAAGLFLTTCVVVAIVLALLLFPSPIAFRIPTPSPASPSTAWYQIRFTSPKYPDKESDHHGGLDEDLVKFIASSKTSVDMAIYQLDLPNVTRALQDAVKRGVRVRIVTDVDILEDPKENPSLLLLQKSGVPVVGGNSNAIMHNKFVVIDKSAVWTGSWNFTVNDTYRYNNNAIQIQSSELARNYTATFEKMFSERKFGPQRKPGGTTPRMTINGFTVENYFAPEDKVAEKLVPRLKAATKSIDFMAFSFTHDDIGTAVLDRFKAGVKVRGVFETTGSETRFSEYSTMKKAGLDVWQDANSYLMHHKVFIVDGKTAIFGSFNFSQNAETENDENLLIIDDPSLAQAFTAEFDRVYGQARSPGKK